MRNHEIKLTNSFAAIITRCLLYTTVTVLLYIYMEQTRLMWILLIVFSVAAFYNWIRLIRREVILLIGNDGMKYEGKMIKWETIVDFETVTYQDSEAGNNTHLILNLSSSHLSVNINISKLNTNEKQIREWIEMYTTLPVDRGHRTVSI